MDTGTSWGIDHSRDGPILHCQPHLLTLEAASAGRALLLPASKDFAPSDGNGPFQEAWRCSAAAASDCKSAKRRQVLTLFLTLGEMILIQTTFGVKFRKNTKHLAQQETSATNLGRFWLQWGVTGDPLQPATVMTVFGFCISPSLKQASFLKRDNFQGFWVLLYSKGALCANSAWFPAKRRHYFNKPV